MQSIIHEGLCSCKCCTVKLVPYNCNGLEVFLSFQNHGVFLNTKTTWKHIPSWLKEFVIKKNNQPGTTYDHPLARGTPETAAQWRTASLSNDFCRSESKFLSQILSTCLTD